jgi:PEP-CTERM motif
MKCISFVRFALAAAVLASFGAPAMKADASLCDAATGNRITNCGFEGGAVPTTNVPNGWTVSQWNGEEQLVTSPINSGATGLRIANDIGQGGPLFNGAAILSQSFTDTANEIYTFSFFLVDGDSSDKSADQQFQAFFDSTAGTPLFVGDGNNVTGSYSQFSFSVTGTGSDSITFTSYNNPNWFFLDDVEVVDTGRSVGGGPVVPEPSSLMLLGTGLLGCVGSVRRHLKRG